MPLLQNGCSSCVWELYWEALSEWQAGQQRGASKQDQQQQSDLPRAAATATEPGSHTLSSESPPGARQQDS
jgi:hypothetical protein